MVDRVGQQLGNYRLVRLLGRGGFAEVYLGEHLRLKTQAAIKILYGRVADTEVEYFLTEARTIASLEHPHIVRVLDFDVQEGTAFLVMSYAPYGNLRQQYPKGLKLPLATVVNHVKQITDALQYAHNEKVIHRDIKPENMLLGRHNMIMLSDFGIALIAQSSRLQSTIEPIGTAYYMAPEQFQGKPSLVSDQYALGVVTYEWICGSRPFHGTFTELYSQHLFIPPPPLREKVPTVSPDVEKVVLTALAKDPKERFANVHTFAMALEQASKEEAVHLELLPSEASVVNQPLLAVDNTAEISPSQISLPTEAITPASQSAQLTNSVTLPNQTSEPIDAVTPSRNPDVSPRVVENVSSDKSQPSRRGVSRRAIVVGLAGLAIAGGSITWLIRSQSPQFPPIGTTIYNYRGHSEVVNAVGWSPDGQFIASGSADRTVQVWNANTGNTIFTYRGHSNGVFDLVWLHDNKHIVSVDLSTIHMWDAFTGNEGYSFGNPMSFLSIALSPDGTRIAYGGGSGVLEFHDASRGNQILSVHVNYELIGLSWSPDDTRIAIRSGFPDKTVHVWDIASQTDVFAYSSEVSSSPTWSSSSTRIASGVANLVFIWDSATGQNLLNYHGHSDVVNAVAWSPDGQFIASGSADKTVHIWNASTGNTLYIYRGHSDGVNDVVWSSDSKRIASTSGNQILVWQAS